MVGSVDQWSGNWGGGVGGVGGGGGVGFFFNDTATTEIYTLSLHDALPIYRAPHFPVPCREESKERRNARWHTTLLAKSSVLHLGSG